MTIDRNEIDDDTEGQAGRFRGFQPTEGAEGRDDTEGQVWRSGRLEPSDAEDDTEGQAYRSGRVEPAGEQDDTEGHMPFRKGVEPAGDEGEEDDVEGHLRLTDDQLATGSSPSEILGAERRQGGQRDNPTGPPRR